jgi:hypothetical protein
MIIDDDILGRRLEVELSSRTARFSELSTGQRRSAENAVRIGQGKIFYACCHHHTPEPGVQIDTRADVVQFQIMCWRDGALAFSKILDGKLWPAFVRRWYAGSF